MSEYDVSKMTKNQGYNWNSKENIDDIIPKEIPEFQKGVRRMYADRYFQTPTYKPNGVVFKGPSQYSPQLPEATKRVKDTTDKSAASKPAASSAESKRKSEINKATNFWSNVGQSFGQAYLGK